MVYQEEVMESKSNQARQIIQADIPQSDFDYRLTLVHLLMSKNNEEMII